MDEIKSLCDNDELVEQYSIWSYKIKNFLNATHESENLLKIKRSEIKLIQNEILIQESNLNKIQSDKERVKEQCQSLNKILSNLIKEQESLNFEIKVNKPKTSRSIECKQHLELGHEKFHYYKHLTGVRWDYQMIESSIKGAITNSKDYLQEFMYPLDTDDITDKLWGKIYNSVKHHIPIVQSNKENKTLSN